MRITVKTNLELKVIEAGRWSDQLFIVFEEGERVRWFETANDVIDYLENRFRDSDIDDLTEGEVEVAAEHVMDRREFSETPARRFYRTSAFPTWKLAFSFVCHLIDERRFGVEIRKGSSKKVSKSWLVRELYDVQVDMEE